MKVDELKYVVGEAQEAKPVYMRFYGKIDEESTRNFNDEFLWIQDYVKPSKIVISINSEGGSVLYGMGTFSIIQQLFQRLIHLLTYSSVIIFCESNTYPDVC